MTRTWKDLLVMGVEMRQREGVNERTPGSDCFRLIVLPLINGFTVYKALSLTKQLCNGGDYWCTKKLGSRLRDILIKSRSKGL